MKTVAKQMNQPQAQDPRDIAEFEAVIRTFPDGAAAPVQVSAALASEIVGRWNTGNRRLDQVAVARYARDMRESRWQADREIAFGVMDDGIRLGDGQHRLCAQGQSSTAQRYIVRVFTDADEFSRYVLTVDGGKARTLANQFSIFGVADGSGAAQRIERVCNAMQTFLGQRPSTLSMQERMDFAIGHQPSLKFVLSLPHRQFKAHVLAAIAIAHGKKKKLVESFVEELVGAPELKGPALVLSRSLPDLNAAPNAKEKDRATAIVLRVLWDVCSGRSKTTVAKAQLAGPVLEAVVGFCGRDVADKFLVRMKPQKVPA